MWEVEGQSIRQMLHMSESAAIVKPFFLDPLHKMAVCGYTTGDRSGDKPLGSKLSADFGPRPGWGLAKR
jgi:hypothetical protein